MIASLHGEKARRRLTTTVATTLLLLITVIALSPFYVATIMGTHYTEDLYKGIVLLPGKFFIENLRTVMEVDFFRWYGNSIYVTIVATTLSVFVSAMAGYGIAAYQFKLKRLVFGFVLATMMIPGHISLVGLVIQLRYMGMINTRIALIVTAIASSFGVFWMTQYIKSGVPLEILDSARIDGSGDFRTFMQIVFPLLAPALTTLAMLQFLWTWNSYLFPLVILHDARLYTIPLGITTIGDYHRYDRAAQILGLTLGTLPLLVIYIFGSKVFVRGLVAGAIK